MSIMIKSMLGIYFILFFIALFAICGCSSYRSKDRAKETTIKMDGEEFKIVDDEVYPENVYHVKFVHVTM